MSTELFKLLEKARQHVMTPKERYEQRVSFIWGQLKPEDTRTVQDIKNFLAKIGIVDPDPSAPSDIHHGDK